MMGSWAIFGYCVMVGCGVLGMSNMGLMFRKRGK
jgi:hypothetical protein